MRPFRYSAGPMHTTSRLRAAVLVVIFSCAVSLAAISSSIAQSTDTDTDADAMDRSVKPGDDFYRYANGGWLKWAAIHAGQPSYSNGAALIEKTSRRVRDLIEAEIGRAHV